MRFDVIYFQKYFLKENQIGSHNRTKFIFCFIFSIIIILFMNVAESVVTPSLKANVSEV